MTVDYKEANHKLENKYFYEPIEATTEYWGLESITCDLPLEHLFNVPRQESATYLDLNNRQIVVFNNDEEPGMNCIRIPDLEWLAPYNETLHEFLGDAEIPPGISASQHLKSTDQFIECCDYRIKSAKSALDTRLAAFGLKIVD